jgi:hypothetical protein
MASTARLGAQSGLELSEAMAAAAGARAEGGDETKALSRSGSQFLAWERRTARVAAAVAGV